MNICILTYQTGTYDGGGRFINALRNELIKRGHHVDVPKYSGNFFSFVRAVRRMRGSYDVIHAVDEHLFGVAAFLATLCTNTPYVITAQGTYAVAPLYNLKTGLITRIAYRHAAAVVAISSFTAKMIQERIPGLPVTTIGHGVTMPPYHAQSPRKSYLLSVGALKPRKGYEVSLRAFASAKKHLPELRYVIVGSQTQNPRYVEYLKSLARELGVQESVDFRTRVTDAELDELYRDTSLFVLTSVNQGLHFEGFGLVFLEAAARGKASVGTKDNGIEDAVIDGETGVLVQQNNVGAAAEAIVRLMRDVEARERMGIAALRYAENSSWAKAAERYEQTYRGVVTRVNP